MHDFAHVAFQPRNPPIRHFGLLGGAQAVISASVGHLVLMFASYASCEPGWRHTQARHNRAKCPTQTRPPDARDLAFCGHGFTSSSATGQFFPVNLRQLCQRVQLSVAIEGSADNLIENAAAENFPALL